MSTGIGDRVLFHPAPIENPDTNGVRFRSDQRPAGLQAVTGLGLFDGLSAPPRAARAARLARRRSYAAIQFWTSPTVEDCGHAVDSHVVVEADWRTDRSRALHSARARDAISWHVVFSKVAFVVKRRCMNSLTSKERCRRRVALITTKSRL